MERVRYEVLLVLVIPLIDFIFLSTITLMSEISGILASKNEHTFKKFNKSFTISPPQYMSIKLGVNA